jgi:multiple sugar transport system ATP-binding protein
MTMSDRVAMMDNGTILQLGRPSDLYARPVNLKVAQFIGTPAINLLPATAGSDGMVELFGTRCRCARVMPRARR